MTGPGRSLRVAVVGGGPAGITAAARLVRAGATVELFEAHRRLGGRASSFVDPATGQLVDFGQHVSMGCCTALTDLLDEAGLSDTFESHDRYHFVSRNGRCRTLKAVGWLPAPLHLLPSLLRLDGLTVAERWRIVRAIRSMQHAHASVGMAPGWSSSADEPAAEWLARHGQSQQAIDRFWSPIVISALSETLDRASLHLTRKVIVDGLLGSRRSYELLIPRVPLAEIFDHRLGDWLSSQGVTIHRSTPVKEIGGKTIKCRGDSLAREFDAVVLAVPWDRLGRIVASELLAAMPELDRLDAIGWAAITTVHLQYDRPITHLAHAALVDRLSQWIFAKPDDCYQVVISASHVVARMSRDALADCVHGELAEAFPAARTARLLRHRVVVQPKAVLSARPGVESFRPAQKTPLARLALAGDWTAMLWPATMESAVRSGNAAAEVILRGND